MTIYNEKTRRRVVPRWRNSTAAAASKDFQALRSAHRVRPVNPALLQIQSSELAEAPDLGRAAELLATAMRLGESGHARTAAQFIFKRRAEAPGVLVTVATSVLEGVQMPLLTEHIASDAVAVARLRDLLKYRPRSANLWVDLARHQAALGETTKAQKSMHVALALAPDHRWVLRSASRLFLHAEEPLLAHRLLAQHPRTKTDPWLIAAEIASAQIAQRPPAFVRKARDMLRPHILSPSHVSELAAAVATLDLEGGARKNARKLLKLALQDPTENALAQVEWADRDFHDGLELESVIHRTPDAFEARCWVRYSQGQIEDALTDARSWLLDEPYATRPVGMVCYLASFLDDYDAVIDAATEAIERHPSEVLHRNNLIYALLSQGTFFDGISYESAVGHVEFLRRQLGTKDVDAVHSKANLGLLFYRLGRPEDGRRLYEMAVAAGEALGNHLMGAHAAVMNGREAILARAAWATEALEAARKLTKRVASPGLDFYLRKLVALRDNPDSAGEVLNPRAAPKFSPSKPITNALKEMRLMQTASGPVLWIPKHLLEH